MKYHSLPSLGELQDYRRGHLNDTDRNWIAGLVEKNPMVAAVLESCGDTNVHSVQKISSEISKEMTRNYLNERGFWSKYAGWIGLSSVLIIFGLFYFFQKSFMAEPAYVEEKTTIKINKPDNFEAVSLIAQKEEKEESFTEVEELSETVKEINTEGEDVKSAVDETMNNLSLPKETESKTLKKEMDSELTPKNTFQESQSGTKNKLEVESNENTLNPGGNESAEVTGTVLLAAKGVHVLSKLNPDDFTTKNKGSSGNDPLGRQETKRDPSASYSMNDLPSFPGGDQALTDYFKGKLRPIKIPKAADQFDKSVMIELEINSRGKLKGHKIHGRLHPTHQEQLVKAIDELPQFNKGNGEKVTYSIVVAF